MPKYLSKQQEKTWKRAKSAFKKQKKRKPGKKDWPLIMHIYKQMKKTATNIVIEPQEKYIKEGLDLAEEIMGSGYFSGIRRIVAQKGEMHNYGKVMSNDKETIYISADRIEGEFPQQDGPAATEMQELEETKKRINRAFQMASTLVHEMGHIKSNFTNGEAPALSEEAQFKNKFEQRLRSDPKMLDRFRRKADLDYELVALANELDRAGNHCTADFVDDAIFKTASPVDMEKIIEGTIDLIGYMVSRVAAENQASFKNSLLLKIRQISTDLSQKRKNPSAGIGAVFGLLKNLLSGLDPSQIAYIIGQIISRAA